MARPMCLVFAMSFVSVHGCDSSSDCIDGQTCAASKKGGEKECQWCQSGVHSVCLNSGNIIFVLYEVCYFFRG